MFRPVVAIIRFYHSTRLRLFYTIRVAACLMRRSQHQNPCRSIVLGVLGVWVNHVIIHKNITLYYQNKNKNKKHEGPVLGKPLVVSLYGPGLIACRFLHLFGVVSVNGLCVT
jgi:hypothetical protein